MKRNQKFGKCERCGCTFDTGQSYAYIDYAHVGPDLACPGHDEFHFALCGLCEDEFNQWLDRGSYRW